MMELEKGQYFALNSVVSRIWVEIENTITINKVVEVLLMEYEVDMENKLNLREILKVVKKRIYIIVLITILACIVSSIVNFYLLKPVYESNMTLIISKSQTNTEDTISSDELSVTEKLAITYGKIIKSRVVLNQVISNLKLSFTYDKLYKNINVQPVEDTQIIKISVFDTNAKRACEIANAIPKIFTKEAIRLTNTNKVEIIDEAIINNNAIKPNKVINISIATIVGFFIGMSIVFLLECLDTKIKSKEDVEQYIGLHVLGSIPNDNTLK